MYGQSAVGATSRKFRSHNGKYQSLSHYCEYLTRLISLVHPPGMVTVLSLLIAPLVPLQAQSDENLSPRAQATRASMEQPVEHKSPIHGPSLSTVSVKAFAASIGNRIVPHSNVRPDRQFFGPSGNPENLCGSCPNQAQTIASNDEHQTPAATGTITPKAPPPVSPSARLDLARDVYYRNRLEFALDAGWLPVNIPFVFDVFLGDGYNLTPLRYTLVPVVASLRWQISDVGGPWIFRGNWDMTFSVSATAFPRGPETHYFSYDMGIRRNFVPRHGKIAPYFDGRAGLGRIDAKEPLGVQFAQGQDFTFTVNMGSGVRYNFNSRYSFSAGLNWMHISNLYLSEPKFANYGINVYGPQFGFDVRLGKPRYHRSE
jgi:Lipid A 3-O-deacylase (PagL)